MNPVSADASAKAPRASAANVDLGPGAAVSAPSNSSWSPYEVWQTRVKAPAGTAASGTSPEPGASA
jgi:hypothetical protein